jgi:phosphodiesterase/alkaline phosphatase D-like protein
VSFLIIGNVTPTSACVWIRGEKAKTTAKVRWRTKGKGAWTNENPRPLAAHKGYTDVITLSGLTADTEYECALSYQSGAAPAVNTGRFRTAPDAAAGPPRDIAFLVASCNFSKLQFLPSKDVDVAWDRIGTLLREQNADFMVHCGDQVYCDLPGTPFPDLPYYQREYQAAWNRKPTAQALASIPNYMMLDDHEIFDGFANDSEYLWRPSQPVRDVALEAYRQYQHSHNPQSYSPPTLYYNFEFGGVHVFALDVRSERWKTTDPQMIGAFQMADFMRWLGVHKNDPKFVISSIPFIAEVRDRGDKWCGDEYRVQREQIIEYLAMNKIGNLCFLTGDMHCSYHMQMTLQHGNAAPITIHELMSSPINQVTSGSHAFIATPQAQTTAQNKVKFQTSALNLDEFYGKHSNVMLVRYVHAARRVDWSVYRTKPVAAAALTGSFLL